MNKMNLVVSMVTMIFLISGCGSSSQGPQSSATGPTLELSPIVVAETGNEAALQISNSVGNSAMLFAEGLFGSVVFKKMISTFSGEIFSGNNNYNPESVSAADETDFKEQVRSHLADLFLISENSDFCGRLFDEEYYHACKDVMRHVVFQIKMTAAHEGVVDAYFDSVKLLSVQFTPAEVDGKISLTGFPVALSSLQAIFNSYSLNIMLPTFSMASGVANLVIHRNGSQIQFSVNVPDGVQVIGGINGSSINISGGRGSSLLLSYARDFGILTANLGIQALDVVMDQAEVKLNELIQGSVVFNHGSEEVQFQNLEIPGAGLVVSNNSVLSFSIALAPISALMAFYNDGVSVAFQSALNVLVNVSDGSTQWSAPSNSKMSIRGSGPFLFENEGLEMNNTGSFGAGSLSVPAGQCFKGQPWQLTGC